MKKYVLFLFLIQGLVYAEDGSNHILSRKNLKGVVLTSPSSKLDKKTISEVSGVEFINITPPGPTRKLKRELFCLTYEKQLTTESLNKIEAAIKNYYIQNGHPFILVKIPKQSANSEVLQVQIIESRIGKVTVEGNKWFPSKRMLNYLELQPEETIDTDQLLNNLNFVNQDSFVQADVIFAPGEHAYTTDLTVVVRERNPLQVYAGTDNTGIDSVGRWRWFVGANWGNAFGLGHIFNAQYTASYNMHRFQAINVNYTAPLSWHHLLNVYGGYSEVHPKLHIHSVRNHGWSCQASLRYQIPLNTYRHLQHGIFVGGDFKRTNNTFEFTDDSPRLGHNVNLTQIALEYRGDYRRDSYQLDFDGSLFWSPGSWLPDQSNADYRTLRRGAKHTWVYFRGGLAYLQKLPKEFSIFWLNRGQISSQNLLPSEQYGIGGYDTVRGYEQRELNKDTALLSSLELRTPYLPVIKNWCAKWRDGIQLRGFIDWGWGTDHIASIPHHNTNYLLGAGPGMTYFYDRYLSVRFDVGFKLHRDHFDGGSPMYHFSLVGNY